MKSLNTNFKRLWQLLEPSYQDIGLVFLYTLFIGVFFLAVPLTAQGLVNALASGVFNQPILILGGAMLVGLLIAGFLRVIQLHLVELIQQKVFIHTALRVSKQLLTVNESAFQQRYAPEVLNRFFDVVTIQKTMAKLLLEGPASMLQIILGMALISIYSPWFILFNVAFILGGVIVLLLGKGGYASSVLESVKKYRVAQWLEEMGQSRISFKMSGSPNSLNEKTDQLLLDYLKHRQDHFSIVIRQSTANFLLEAITTSGLLILGSILVMNGQLTLGQLVASEIVILLILSASDKLVAYLESVYDLFTAVDKVYQVLELSQEESEGRLLPENSGGFHVQCNQIMFGYNNHHPVIQNLTLELLPNSHSSVVGPSGMGKSTLAGLVCGLYPAQQGEILINGINIKQLDLKALRKSVALVSNGYELFEGTVEENILLGLSKDEIPQGALDRAIQITLMDRDIEQYPEGLNHIITTTGMNISLGQRHRILLARAILLQPNLLILDEAMTGMDERTKLTILENLFAPENNWTILNISHDAEIVQRTDYVYLIANGTIVESGLPDELAKNRNSGFAHLFPDLAQQIRGV
jgi:ATP-binding cassette subfamily B protein